MFNPSKPHRPFAATAATGLVGLLALGLGGCKKNQAQSAVPAGDPADANLSQPYTGGNTGSGQTQVLGQTQAFSGQTSGESYETQAPAPIIRQAPAGAQPRLYYPVPQAQTGNASYQGTYNDQQQPYANQQPYDPNQYNNDPNYAPTYNSDNYTDAEEAGEQALVETDQAPPPLPEYDQPPAPEDDYIWTPGYWNYASTGYYWVPGVWCAPPFIGALWTPPYWGYYNNRYLFHRGYWGPHVGYYGGINYGFGYIGIGYFGGYWRDRSFYYNRAVTNVNITNIHNVYDRTVIYDNRVYGPHPQDRVSYNGGRGGLNIQPRPQELAAMREAHYAPLPAQREVRLAAASNRAQFFRDNGGRPAVAYAARPVGNIRDLSTTPREPAFNHGFAPNQPNPNFRPGQPNQTFNNNNRPGDFNRPGQPNQPFNNNNRPGDFNRPGQPNQPFNNNNRPGDLNRPGQPNRPFNNNNRPGDFNHPGQPNQPFNNSNRPGDINRPGQPNQPFSNNNRPGDINHPGQPNQPETRIERPAQNNQLPVSNHRFGNSNNNPAPQQKPVQQPRPEFQRPQPQQQPQQPRQEFQRPEPQQQHPEFQRPQPQMQPQQPRQEFQRPQPPQQQARPEFHPQPAAAPHPNNGNDHGHNR